MFDLLNNGAHIYFCGAWGLRGALELALGIGRLTQHATLLLQCTASYAMRSCAAARAKLARLAAQGPELKSTSTPPCTAGLKGMLPGVLGMKHAHANLT